jgi:hypothetical protein
MWPGNGGKVHDDGDNNDTTGDCTTGYYNDRIRQPTMTTGDDNDCDCGTGGKVDDDGDNDDSTGDSGTCSYCECMLEMHSDCILVQ